MTFWHPLYPIPPVPHCPHYPYGTWGNSVHGVWGRGGMGHGGRGSMGHMGNRGTGSMGYKGYVPHRQWVTWAMGYRGMGNGPMGNLHPKCQKDVKLSKRCQMSKNQTPRLWRRFTKKNKLTQWGSQIVTSILTSQMMVTKNPQNDHRKYFWAILMSFIFDVKIDVNICEPHYVNLFFLRTSSIVQMFDYLTFGIFLTTWHLLTFWHI